MLNTIKGAQRPLVAGGGILTPDNNNLDNTKNNTALFSMYGSSGNAERHRAFSDRM